MQQSTLLRHQQQDIYCGRFDKFYFLKVKCNTSFSLLRIIKLWQLILSILILKIFHKFPRHHCLKEQKDVLGAGQFSQIIKNVFSNFQALEL